MWQINTFNLQKFSFNQKSITIPRPVFIWSLGPSQNIYLPISSWCYTTQYKVSVKERYICVTVDHSQDIYCVHSTHIKSPHKARKERRFRTRKNVSHKFIRATRFSPNEPDTSTRQSSVATLPQGRQSLMLELAGVRTVCVCVRRATVCLYVDFTERCRSRGLAFVRAGSWKR